MAGDAQNGGEYTRLHVTPLTPALLSTILPPSLLPAARNISYHTVQTFPERAYGFLELPKMEASKLQKKLNGSILKGSKIRIETARPQKLHEPEQPDQEPERPKKDRSKKRKRDETIPAAEIGERSVKRGWTVPTSKGEKKSDKKDKKAKSKYTSGKECLFKTVVPPNKLDLKEKKNKKKRDSREEVVHEFAKTVKHASFLRGSKVDGKSKTVGQFVEGKGWVDDEGNLIEEVKTTRKPQSTGTAGEKHVKQKEQSSEDSSSEADSSDVESSDEGELAGSQNSANPVEDDTSEDETYEASASEAEPESTKAKASLESSRFAKDGSPTSSSGSSSKEESESSSGSSDSKSEAEPSDSSPMQDVQTPQSSSTGPRKSNSRPDSSSGLTITIPQSNNLGTPSNNKSVHPLEALYKRPASTPSAKNQAASGRPPVPSFSFFGEDKDGDLEDTEVADQVPLTPFTQREFEFRGQRSAAPTPDTAHPNRRFMWPTDNDNDEEDGERESPSGKDKSKGNAVGSNDGGDEGKEEESEFQKWFYEHRGETNRAWKKRRKVVAKEQRQRENRKRGDRAT